MKIFLLRIFLPQALIAEKGEFREFCLKKVPLSLLFGAILGSGLQWVNIWWIILSLVLMVPLVLFSNYLIFTAHSRGREMHVNEDICKGLYIPFWGRTYFFILRPKGKILSTYFPIRPPKPHEKVYIDLGPQKMSIFFR